MKNNEERVSRGWMVFTLLALAAFIWLLIGYLSVPPKAGAYQTKPPICHVPPGNPGNAHTIYPDENGYNGHFNHHDDYIGVCNQEETTSTTSTSTSTSIPQAPTSSTSTSTTTTTIPDLPRPTVPPCLKPVSSLGCSPTTVDTTSSTTSTTTPSSTSSDIPEMPVAISTMQVELSPAPSAPVDLGITG